MATAANSYYFRRRTMGRAASPPTWACYEQIRYDDEDYSDSCSDSCSEDEEDYSGTAAADSGVRQSRGDMSEDSEDVVVHPTTQDNSNDIDMDMGDGDEAKKHQKDQKQLKDVKGKQRAIEPEPESPRRQRKKRQQTYTLRPILTIQRSQGFVWNQVRWSSLDLRSARLTFSCACRTSSYRRTLKIDVRHFSFFFDAHDMYELTLFFLFDLPLPYYHRPLHSNHTPQMSHPRLHRTLAGSSPPLRHLPTRL